MTTKNKKILLGITGGIAIYKAAEVLRILTKDFGAEVQVVMTSSAHKFMTPLVFETLSGNPVYCDMFAGEYVGTRHIDLAKNADIIAIVPATGNIIAKAANGIADDLLSNVILAGWRKTVFAPAMNVNMWENPATQQNLQTLYDRGMDIIRPIEGMLACNDFGTGKLAEVDDICEFIEAKLTSESLLKGKKVVITAGPTREKIDSVRFISNYSTGKMGIALAKAAYKEGADVTLVAGPISQNIPKYFKTISVESANEMLAALNEVEGNVDYLYMSAAIEDFIPEDFADKKLKKNDMPDAIKIKQAPDIVANFRKEHHETCIVGFSVEMEKGKEHSLQKMQKKQLNFIAWNNPNVEGTTFGHDTNEVTLFAQDGNEWFLPKTTKSHLAHQIIKITTQNRG